MRGFPSTHGPTGSYSGPSNSRSWLGGYQASLPVTRWDYLEGRDPE